MPHAMGGGSRYGSRSSNRHNNRHYHVNYVSKAKPGLRKYAYTDKTGKKRVFYANVKPVRSHPFKEMIFPLILCVFIIGYMFILIPHYFSNAIHLIQTPHALLNTEQYYTGTYISDLNDILSDEEERMIVDSFELLREETGVVPFLQTVHLDNLVDNNQDSYLALEQYGMQYYTYFFQDECHMLLLYGVTSDDENNWTWCQIQGDEVDEIIHTSAFAAFQNDMQEYLNDSSYNVGQAISMSMNNMVPILNERSIDDLLSGIIPILFIVIVIIAIIGIGTHNAMKQVRINEYIAYTEYRKNP